MSGKAKKDLTQERSDTPRMPQRIHWPLQAMPLARAIAIIYVLLIGYGCLNPFNVDWKFGLDPFAWWFGPLPKYITLFDVTINVLGYIPLGFILVFALYPRWQRFRAIAIALVFSALLSGAIESAQSWLPTRVPTQIDWIANLVGALIGALLAQPLGPHWLSGTALRKRFDYWFGTRWLSVALFILFPFAQIYPQSAWLGMGFLGLGINPIASWGLDGIHHTIYEALVTGLSWFGVCLFFSLALRNNIPKLPILAGLLAITITIKSLFTSLQFGSEFGFVWLSAGAIWGMALSSLMAGIFMRFSTNIRLIACISALVALMILVNYFPDNPYFTISLPRWNHSRLAHLNDLMQWLSWLWLPVAFIWLIHFARRANQ
jgi:VanZ family protein